MEIKPRAFQDPNQSFFLFGPRGTGKTTWLRQKLENAIFIELLDPESFRNYSARPERLREVVEGQRPGTTIVIDEIQKVPQLLDVVHQLIEQKSGWRFILTGSSARKLKRADVDLLAGRAVVKTMHPFMAGELGEDFLLEKALTLGMVPLVLDAPNPEERLELISPFTSGKRSRWKVLSAILVPSIDSWNPLVSAMEQASMFRR